MQLSTDKKFKKNMKSKALSKTSYTFTKLKTGKKYYVNKYRNNLYILALAILKNEADAEDAVGNAILKAYENIGQLRAFHKFKP